MDFIEEWTMPFGPGVAAIVAQTPERLAKRGLRIVGGEDYPRVADDNDNILLVMYASYDSENSGWPFMVERREQPDAVHFSPTLVASHNPERYTQIEIEFELTHHSSERRSDLHLALAVNDHMEGGGSFCNMRLSTFPVYYLQKCRPGSTYVLDHGKTVIALEDAHQIEIAPIEELVPFSKSAAE